MDLVVLRDKPTWKLEWASGGTEKALDDKPGKRKARRKINGLIDYWGDFSQTLVRANAQMQSYEGWSGGISSMPPKT